MEIVKIVKITMTPQEVKELIITHIENIHGIKLDVVNFDVNEVHDHNDYGHSGSYEMTKVCCTGYEI